MLLRTHTKKAGSIPAFLDSSTASGKRSVRFLTQQMSLLTVAIFQVSEKLAIGLEQHNVIAATKGIAIGLQAAPEGVKLRILAIS